MGAFVALHNAQLHGTALLHFLELAPLLRQVHRPTDKGNKCETTDGYELTGAAPMKLPSTHALRHIVVQLWRYVKDRLR